MKHKHNNAGVKELNSIRYAMKSFHKAQHMQVMKTHLVGNANKIHSYPHQVHISLMVSGGHSMLLQIHRHHVAQVAVK